MRAEGYGMTDAATDAIHGQAWAINARICAAQARGDITADEARALRLRLAARAAAQVLRKAPDES